MSDSENCASWNRHKWRRDPSWWDELEVPTKQLEGSGDEVFFWLENVAPDPYEHDYVLYTDGSGCSGGWGGYAALYERIELDGSFRGPVASGTALGGTYGSTVQRSEFNAFLEGVHRILTEQCDDLEEKSLADDELRYRLGTEGLLNQFTGPSRVTILWYTDRSNLAQSLLFDEEGDPLFSRAKERDLWMRWSFLTRHVCITPMYCPRNVVEGQAACDKLASVARSSVKSSWEMMADAAKQFHPHDQWNKKTPQAGRF